MFALINISLEEIKFHTRVWLGGAKLIREVGLFDCQLVHIASASLYSRVVSLFFHHGLFARAWQVGHWCGG